MLSFNHNSYNVKFSTNSAAAIIDRIERAVVGVDKDLVILASLLLAIGKSSPDAISDPKRLRSILDSLSEHLAWILSLPEEIDPKTAN